MAFIAFIRDTATVLCKVWAEGGKPVDRGKLYN